MQMMLNSSRSRYEELTEAGIMKPITAIIMLFTIAFTTVVQADCDATYQDCLQDPFNDPATCHRAYQQCQQRNGGQIL